MPDWESEIEFVLCTAPKKRRRTSPRGHIMWQKQARRLLTRWLGLIVAARCSFRYRQCGSYLSLPFLSVEPCPVDRHCRDKRGMAWGSISDAERNSELKGQDLHFLINLSRDILQSLPSSSRRAHDYGVPRVRVSSL
jgi:hypothetical protein